MSVHVQWLKVWLTRHVDGSANIALVCWLALALYLVLCVCTANGQITHGLANGDVLVSSLSMLKVSLILPQLMI